MFDALHDGFRWVAASHVTRRVTAALGIQGRFHTLYWRGQHLAHRGTCTQPVAGTTVTFPARTPDEFRHCHTLMGERAVLDDLLAHVDAADVFFDVGAYLGVYTAFVGATYPTVRTVAFEPDPDKRAGLERVVAANGLTADVRDCGLSDETGVVSFATSRGTEGPNVSRVATGRHDHLIEVPVTTVDHLVGDGTTPPPSVVKIDVEGAEVGVLRGMRETLTARPPRVIYCEVHPTLLPSYGDAEGDARSLLEAAGYAVTRLATRGDEYFLRATRPAS